MNAHAAIEKGKEIIRIEAEAIAALESRINGTFASASFCSGFGGIGLFFSLDFRMLNFYIL